MVDVVGLRFVAEGEQETIAALKRYAAVKTEIGRATQQSLSSINAMQRQLQSLAQGFSQGRIGADNYRESLREIKRQYAELAGVSLQKASAEVERFNRAIQAQAQTRLDTQARQAFEGLAASLDSALAATNRFQAGMQTVDVALARNVVSANEAARVQERLKAQMQTVLDAPRNEASAAFDRLRASIDPTVAAQLRMAAAQRTVDAAVRQGVVSADEGAQTMREYAAALNNTAKANEILRTETQMLARAYNPAMAALQVFEREQEQLNRAFQLGVLSADAYQAKLTELQTAYNNIGTNVGRAANFVNQFGAVTQVAGIRTNNFGLYAQQVGYQVGDFFVQIQSGTNAFVAFGQQATQLAGLLPGLTGAILGIGISVSTMFLAMWSRTRDATDAATTALERYEEALKSVRDEITSTEAVLAALSEGFESAAQGSVIQGIRASEAEIVRLRESLTALQDEITRRAERRGGALPQFDDEGRITNARDLAAVIQDQALAYDEVVERTLLALNAEQERIRQGQEALRLERERAAQRRQMEAVTNRVAELTAENVLVAAQIEYMRQGVEMAEARRRAEEDVLLQQAMIVATAEGATDAQRALVDQLVEGVNQARELKRIADGLQGAFDAAAAAAGRIAGALSGAAGQLRNMMIDLRGAELQNRLLAAGADPSVARARSEAETFRSRQLAEIGGGGALMTRNQQLQLEQQVNQFYETRLALLREGERYTNLTRGAAGGGGGGGGPTQTLGDILAGMEEQINRERTLLGLRGEQLRVQELIYEIQDQLTRAGVAYTQEEVAAAAARIAAGEEELRLRRQLLEETQALTNTIQNSFASAFMAVVDGTKSAKDAFKDMARQIIAELFRILVVQQLVGQIGTAIGNLGPIGNIRLANGGVMSAGNIVPFAKGGVVGGPMLFPMTGGRTGLMGEAGPEAIMPLKRGRDGKLGVAAEGGGGGTNVVQTFNFNLSANGDESVQRIVAKAAPEIIKAAKNGVLDARRRGGAYRAAFSG